MHALWPRGVRMCIKVHVDGAQGIQCVQARDVWHVHVHTLLCVCVRALWARVTRMGKRVVSRSKAVSRGKILAGGNYIPTVM